MLRLLTTPWNWKRGMDDFSIRASRPANNRISGFWPLQLWKKKNYVVLSHGVVAIVVIGYDSPRKWISIGSHNFTSGIYSEAFPSRSALSSSSSAFKVGLPTIISALFLPKGPYHLLPSSHSPSSIDFNKHKTLRFVLFINKTILANLEYFIFIYYWHFTVAPHSPSHSLLTFTQPPAPSFWP